MNHRPMESWIIATALFLGATAAMAVPPNDHLKITKEQQKKGYVVCPKCEGNGCAFCDRFGGFKIVRCKWCDGAGEITEHVIEQPKDDATPRRTLALPCPECNGKGCFLVPGKK